MIRLTPECSPKLLEEPCVYNRATDELYVLNRQAFDFIEGCGSGRERPAGSEDAAFVDYCLEEGILEPARSARQRGIIAGRAPVPSLRYLLVHITDRCNLVCRHCFGGAAGKRELSLSRFERLVDEFVGLQGLRLMISGGEPLLHSQFAAINEIVDGKDLRTVLMTNGMLLTRDVVRRLRFQEVQVSLDGMRDAHDYLRSAGAFDRAVAALGLLADAGVQVSVATMVHSRNLDDFDALARMLAGLGVREWRIDMPSPAGRLAAGSDLLVDPAAGGPLLARSYGGAVHEPSPGYACGAHLMAVMADGGVARCGFYAAKPVGTIEDGLAACWERIDRVRLKQLSCDCEFLEDCRGGCRFRAGGYTHAGGPDPCQCYRYGVRTGGPGKRRGKRAEFGIRPDAATDPGGVR
ncbi:MAG: radical SAM protein [Thermoleophilia bacterium]